MESPLVLVTELPDAAGAVPTAAAVGVAAATLPGNPRGAALLVEAGSVRRRAPTMLASRGARELEDHLRAAGLEAAARGALCWLCLSRDADAPAALREAAGLAEGAPVVGCATGSTWRRMLDEVPLDPAGVVLCAELPAQRALAALAALDLRAAGLAPKLVARAPGPVAARRAVAGLDPGGRTGARGRRLAQGLLGAGSARGQALPLVLGAAGLLVIVALVLAAIGGAVTGKARAQRVADLAALSAARSMRDDYPRLFVPARLPDGRANPRHLDRERYLARAARAARQAARRNGADANRLRIEFPAAESFAPLRVRAELGAELAPAVELGDGGQKTPVAVAAEARAAAPSDSASAAGAGASDLAGGGGYTGPLARRQGKPMRPDVARAFDRLAAAAARAGHALVVSSGYRSDAEQAALFAANPDPRWVAPPGQSLHRCGTELDLGPVGAYGWLAANAPRFGFVRRYEWEPWHFGYVRGPAPCSGVRGDAGRAAGGTGTQGRAPRDRAADGLGGGTALPAYVPRRFRAPIASAATRWNVSAGLLAAQLLTESNFNPFAVSPAGARGIAQFMPATAAAYGVRDPFDPDAAIEAQARLMSELLAQFGSVSLALAAYNAGPGAVAKCRCVPPYPETESYVARILGLLGGAGELPVPALEVRLVA